MMNPVDRRYAENRIASISRTFGYAAKFSLTAAGIMIVCFIVQAVANARETGFPALAAYTAVLLCATTLVIMFMLVNFNAFCKRIEKTGTPFHAASSQALFRIGYAIIALALLWGLIVPALDVLLGTNLGNVTYSLLIWAGMLVVLLAHVFKYGCALQEQDDELI